MNKKCKATKIVNGRVHHCTMPRGHFSVHFSGDQWWNHDERRSAHDLSFWVLFGAIAFIIGAIIAIFL